MYAVNFRPNVYVLYMSSTTVTAEAVKKWDGARLLRCRGLCGEGACPLHPPQLWGSGGVTPENLRKYGCKIKSVQFGAFLATNATENVQRSVQFRFWEITFKSDTEFTVPAVYVPQPLVEPLCGTVVACISQA